MGYVIYSQRVQPEVNESHIHKVPENDRLIFYMGDVSELRCKTMVNNSLVFNLSNRLVVLKITVLVK